jgi:4-hydroxy-2-oxoheptanedioate aldolase
MSTASDLRAKETLFGFWSVTGHPAIVDAAASVGPDFVVVDTQHGVDLGQVDASLFTVLADYGVAALVRVASLDVAPIGRALDLGADGIVVPLVDTADDARRAVSATRYAPRGGRSFGMQTRRLDPLDTEPFVVIQIETAEAAANVDEIADVRGVDALYIGPADLGLGLGGQPAANVDSVFDGTHPNSTEIAKAFRAVVKACEAHGIVPGIHVGDGATAARAHGEGFRFSAVTSDVGLASAGLARELSEAREE